LKSSKVTQISQPTEDVQKATEFQGKNTLARGERPDLPFRPRQQNEGQRTLIMVEKHGDMQGG
jgi:hypothetical protein